MRESNASQVLGLPSDRQGGTHQDSRSQRSQGIFGEAEEDGLVSHHRSESLNSRKDPSRERSQLRKSHDQNDYEDKKAVKFKLEGKSPEKRGHGNVIIHKIQSDYIDDKIMTSDIIKGQEEISANSSQVFLQPALP